MFRAAIRQIDDLLRLPSRQRNDRSTQAELNWERQGETLPPGLELQWLGTAGFRLRYGGFDLLIDPYVSRPTLRKVVSRAFLQPSPEALEHIVGADAVLVGHTHFDHALDVPPIARRFGCSVYGSDSLQRLMALHGLAEQTVVVEDHHVYEVGPFAVTFVPSVHSKLLLGLRVPTEGELTCDCFDGLNAGAYRCGRVFGIHISVAGFSLYHQGSADLLEAEVRHTDVDVFLCGIAGRGFTDRYVERVLRALSPAVVLAQHHDDFFRDLSSEMAFSLNVNLGGFASEVAAVSSDFRIRTLEPLQVVGSPSGARV
jgi:L-ascorbate metabolism protein UlaG (beta-lactamase superfamily)